MPKHPKTQLEDKLAELGAIHLNYCKGPNGSKLEFYTVGLSVVMIQYYKGDQGFEIYSPIFNGNNLKATLEALTSLKTYSTTKLGSGGYIIENAYDKPLDFFDPSPIT
jgi:hypothetical protein